MATPTVLVTGFEPFGGEPVNPSAQAVQALHGRVVEGRRVVAAVLPCVFGDALVALERAVRATDPELVLCVGQAGGRGALSLERVAINVDDAPIADNAGARPIDRPIAPEGPAAYFSTLPIKAMVAALRAAGLPGEVSQTAGTFVCNHVLYGLMRTLEGRAGTRGGFVHVPFLPEQAARHPGAPSLSLERIVRGLELALATALGPQVVAGRDLAAAEGATA